jgi:hypothetical protein
MLQIPVEPKKYLNASFKTLETRYSMMMAHVVCCNMSENWQSMKNIFSTYEVSSTKQLGIACLGQRRLQTVKFNLIQFTAKKHTHYRW